MILALAIVLFVLRRCNQPVTNTTVKKSSAKTVNRNHGLDRNTSMLEYTRHADCRMDCRKISKQEVEEILKNGVINYRKSNVKAKPCPTYAVEGTSSDNQRLRVVFAQCDLKTKVVTCIDLDTDWACDCPGDDPAGNPTRRQN